MANAQNMLLTTTETLAEGLVVAKVFSLVIANYSIKISQQGLLEKLTQPAPGDLGDAFDMLRRSAPDEANAIIGIKTSTATAAFANGVFLYVTLTGTPVVYVDADE